MSVSWLVSLSVIISLKIRKVTLSTFQWWHNTCHCIYVYERNVHKGNTLCMIENHISENRKYWGKNTMLQLTEFEM